MRANSIEMQEYSVLQKANRSDVQRDPFPHIVIHDALPAGLYDKLASTFPSAKQLGVEASGSNVRWDYSAHQVISNESIPAVWKKFIQYHASQAFLEDVLNIFEDDILRIYHRHYPSRERLRSLRAGVRNLSKSRVTDVHLDAQISGNTAVASASSVRTTHLDQGNKLFSGLFYMKPDDYHVTGGDLTISRFAKDLAGSPDRYTRIRNAYVDETDVEHLKVVAYERNTLVLFLNTLDSLHGVTVRQPTDKTRLFVNLVGVVRSPLYHTGSDGAHYAGADDRRSGGNFLGKFLRNLVRN